MPRQNHNNNPFNPVPPSLERTLLFTVSTINEAWPGPCLLVCAANILPPSSGCEEASKLLPTIVGEYETFVQRNFVEMKLSRFLSRNCRERTKDEQSDPRETPIVTLRTNRYLG